MHLEFGPQSGAFYKGQFVIRPRVFIMITTIIFFLVVKMAK